MNTHKSRTFNSLACVGLTVGLLGGAVVSSQTVTGSAVFLLLLVLMPLGAGSLMVVQHMQASKKRAAVKHPVQRPRFQTGRLVANLGDISQGENR